MNILERLWFRTKTGSGIVDIGRVEEVVISYKGLYISLLINEDGEPVSLGWSDDPGMFNVPIRDFWQAYAPDAVREINSRANTKPRRARASHKDNNSDKEL